jgi:uncharacterized protein YceK
MRWCAMMMLCAVLLSGCGTVSEQAHLSEWDNMDYAADIQPQN